MYRRTPSAQQSDHKCVEMQTPSKLWVGLDIKKRGFVISYQQRSRRGLEQIREVVSLTRARNFCAMHNLPMPAETAPVSSPSLQPATPAPAL